MIHFNLFIYKMSLLKLDQLILNLNKLNDSIISSVDRNKTKQLQADKRVLIKDIDQLCKLCKNLITDKEIEDFNHLIIKYLKIQESFRNTNIHIYATQLMMVDPNITMDEAINKIKTGKIDTDKILCLVHPSFITGQESYNYVKERHKEILKLEKSINELKELFISTYAITMDQGNTIDGISANTSTAKQHVSKAKRELQWCRK